jgi:DNA-binding LacI/PurR family transcriptional regulator
MYLSRVGGIIVSISQTTKTSEHFTQLLKHGVKMVFFDRVCEDLDVYKVMIDDFESSFNAVNYLLSNGYKNIYHFAGPQNLDICRERKMGYEKAMLAQNIIAYVNSMEGGMHESDGYESMDKLLKNNILPDAIFAVNDPVAIGAFKRLKDQGIKIPGQVGIMGFSNNPITEFVDPPLTTVEQPAFEMGKAAAKLLIDQITGVEIKLDSKELKLATRLIIRQST